MTCFVFVCHVRRMQIEIETNKRSEEADASKGANFMLNMWRTLGKLKKSPDKTLNDYKRNEDAKDGFWVDFPLFLYEQKGSTCISFNGAQTSGKWVNNSFRSSVISSDLMTFKICLFRQLVETNLWNWFPLTY